MKKLFRNFEFTILNWQHLKEHMLLKGKTLTMFQINKLQDMLGKLSTES